jgi:hypothetical protein
MVAHVDAECPRLLEPSLFRTCTTSTSLTFPRRGTRNSLTHAPKLSSLARLIVGTNFLPRRPLFPLQSVYCPHPVISGGFCSRVLCGTSLCGCTAFMMYAVKREVAVWLCTALWMWMLGGTSQCILELGTGRDELSAYSSGFLSPEERALSAFIIRG